MFFPPKSTSLYIVHCFCLCMNDSVVNDCMSELGQKTVVVQISFLRLEWKN